jgi:hypothetical protein
MSSPKGDRLLRCFPRAWRARYGEELKALIVASSTDGRVPWRIHLDVVRSGIRERLRDWGLGRESSPKERARAGSLLVLCSWVFFVVAGVVVQKFSEHWQQVTPASHRELPVAAFGTLSVAAVLGSMLVLLGVACALPSFAGLLRAGRWPEIRGVFLSAGVLSALSVAGTVTLVLWAHNLDAAQRNGHDFGYELGFGAWALLMLGSLMALTVAVLAAARRIDLTPRLVKVEALLAGAVSATMLTMTVATVVWWRTLAHIAPWALHGTPPGATSSAIALQPFAASLLMALATALAVSGTTYALRALPRLAES